MNNLLKLIQETLNLESVHYKDKGDLIALVASEAIASTLPLPTSPTTNVSGLFLTQHKVNVEQELALLNEQIVIDIDSATELVFQIWSIRYSLVHQMNDLHVGRLLSAIVSTNACKIKPEFIRVAQEYPKSYLGRFALDKLSQE